MTTHIQPILPGEPMPHRKVMREWLIPLAERTTELAIVMLVVDLVLWGALMAVLFCLNLGGPSF